MALPNSRWEIFATGLASGMTKKAAYEQAGFSGSSSAGNASVLSRHPEITARVAELIESRTKFQSNFVSNGELNNLAAVDDIAGTGIVDRAWVATMLAENARMAREAGQFGASNQALKMLGEISMAPLTEQTVRSGEPSITIDSVNILLEHIAKDSTDGN